MFVGMTKAPHICSLSRTKLVERIQDDAASTVAVKAFFWANSLLSTQVLCLHLLATKTRNSSGIPFLQRKTLALQTDSCIRS